MSSPINIVHRKLKQRPFRVLVLGQAGVGKTALTVRFITRRFIGEYDPTLERKYFVQVEIDDDVIPMDILDTAGQDPQADSLYLDEHIRWADAYILMFCVTDHCSLDHLTHLRFHINHKIASAAKSNKPWRSSALIRDQNVPVLLVGNKNDLSGQRMVLETEGRRRADELGCVAYHDISVRESYDEAREVFIALYRSWKAASSSSKGGASSAISGNNNHEKNNRKVLRRQDELRVSPPPSPRRRSHRSSLFRTGHSSSTDSDTTNTVTSPTSPGPGATPDGTGGGCGCNGAGGGGEREKSGPFLEVHNPVKRKQSVHKRIMMKVLPHSFKLSRESADENVDQT